MVDIKSAVQFVTTIENIQSKDDLNKWCGTMGKNKLYSYIRRLAPEHWERIGNPKNCVRFYYQQILKGYKLYKYMTQQDKQSTMIDIVMKICDDYHKLQKNYDKFRALYINRSDDYSVLEGKNASLQNQVETLKKRLRLANERHFNRQFENHNNTK